MIEIRYRQLLPPGVPSPFDGWFARTPGATVHGTGLRFEGEDATGRFIASRGEGAMRPFLDDLLANPPPRATRWELREVQDDVALFDVAWKEPSFDPIPSPMKLARDLLGPQAQISFTMQRDSIVHRHLVPETVDPNVLWRRLLEVTARFNEMTGLQLRMELERLGPWIPTDRLPPAEARGVLLTAFMLGYYDSPPRATLRDLAVATGVPGSVLLGHLKDAERALTR